MKIAKTTGKPVKSRKKPCLTAEEREAKDAKNANSNHYKRKNKKRTSDVNKAWMKKNKSKRKAYMDSYNADRKEAQRIYDAERYLRPENVAKREAKKEERRAYMKEFSKNNRHIWQAADQKRKAVKRKNPIGNQKLIKAWISRWRKLKSVICYWCRKSCDPRDCHGDHVIPLAKGGTHCVENMCIACGDCNRHKHDKPLHVWNQQIAEPVLF